MNIELDDDTISGLMAGELKQSHRNVFDELVRLTNLSLQCNIDNVGKEEMADALILHNAFIKVIEYYSTPDEFQEFLKTLSD